MSINEVIERLEARKAEVEAEIRALQARAEVLDEMLPELRGVSGGRSSSPTTRKARAAKAPAAKTSATRAPAAKAKQPGRRGRKPKGAMSARDAILKVVGEAGEPIPIANILPRAQELSGGKPGSLRTAVNAALRSGDLKKIPHEGRGFLYQRT